MITTSRLLIQSFSEHHAQDFFELTQDEGFVSFLITDYKQSSVEAAREWISKNKGKYGVWEKEGGNLVGMGGLTHWKFNHENLVDITYRLRTSAWGKGYGFELTQALVQYGFNDLNLSQITATITPDNLGSKKIAEKLGMKFDQRIELLGVPTDLYRLLKA